MQGGIYSSITIEGGHMFDSEHNFQSALYINYKGYNGGATQYRGLIIGDGKNKMDYVFVKDVAKAAYLASKSSKIDGDYIVGSGMPLTLNEIVASVAKSINTSVIPFHIPKFIALPISYIALWVFKLSGIKPIFFPNRVRVMTRNCYFNIERARRELNYKPTVSFGEGTKLTGGWLLKNKLI